MDTLVGYLDHIVYNEEEKGFLVGRLKDPKQREPVNIVGYLPGVRPGNTLVCQGKWKVHPKHGKQFEIASFQSRPPTDALSIQKYLESGLVKGIGPANAKRIVEHFGDNTLDVIDKTPDALIKVPGIGKGRVDMIKTCWAEQRAIRDVMLFLRSYEISPTYAQKIFKRYGENCVQKLMQNPYRLAQEIRGIGFAKADAIAAKMEIASDAPVRIVAGIEHKLWELSEDGHTCFPKEELLVLCSEMLATSPEKIKEQMDVLTKEGAIVSKEEMIALKPLYIYEQGIARECERLKHSGCSLRAVDCEKAVEWVQEKLGITLAKEQIAGVQKSISEKFHILTGGPGTGKSTITNAILKISEKLSNSILLAAPTGRAAKRMSEITRKKAQTIHALLEVDFHSGGFKKGKTAPLNCDLLIVDEASMIDAKLMYYLLRAIPSHARVVLIGDIDQLPSVGPGNVLKDLIKADFLPVTRLTEIFRQGKFSNIVVSAHNINQGKFPTLQNKPRSDFFFLSKESPEEISDTILDLVSKRVPKKYRFHKFDQIQVLSPMKRGVLGTDNLNTILQNTLNPSQNHIHRMGNRFHVGDKVMQIRNNYQKHVYNGDVGKIDTIDISDQIVVVTYGGRRVEYSFSELDELTLAYAVSIHKYQGSECPCIIIPIHTSHFKLLFRNLLYTGITRGKKMVILVGTKKALAMAIHNNDVLMRHTQLVSAMDHFFGRSGMLI